MASREELTGALDKLRQYGVQHVELTGRAIPPWMRDWAAEHDVAFVDAPDAPLGTVYLRHKASGHWELLDV